MSNQTFSSALVLILVVAACLASSGCRGGFRCIASCDSPSCGCAEQTCDLPSCGMAGETCESPSCGCAEEACNSPSCGMAGATCDSPSCGIPSCGCAEEACDTVGCGNRVGCGKGPCGWLIKLFGCFNLCGCAGCDGELYWSEWYNDPPGCEPCDSCGNWIGPRGVYRAPYRTHPGQITEPYRAQLDEPTTLFPIPEEEPVPEEKIVQDQLLEDGTLAESRLNNIPDDPRADITFQEEQAEESFELVLERETIFR